MVQGPDRRPAYEVACIRQRPRPACSNQANTSLLGFAAAMRRKWRGSKSGLCRTAFAREQGLRSTCSDRRLAFTAWEAKCTGPPHRGRTTRQNRLPRCGHPAGVESAVRIEKHAHDYARVRYAQGCQGAARYRCSVTRKPKPSPNRSARQSARVPRQRVLSGQRAMVLLAAPRPELSRVSG